MCDACFRRFAVFVARFLGKGSDRFELEAHLCRACANNLYDPYGKRGSVRCIVRWRTPIGVPS